MTPQQQGQPQQLSNSNHVVGTCDSSEIADVAASIDLRPTLFLENNFSPVAGIDGRIKATLCLISSNRRSTESAGWTVFSGVENNHDETTDWLDRSHCRQHGVRVRGAAETEAEDYSIHGAGGRRSVARAQLASSHRSAVGPIGSAGGHRTDSACNPCGPSQRGSGAAGVDAGSTGRCAGISVKPATLGCSAWRRADRRLSGVVGQSVPASTAGRRKWICDGKPRWRREPIVQRTAVPSADIAIERKMRPGWRQSATSEKTCGR